IPGAPFAEVPVSLAAELEGHAGRMGMWTIPMACVWAATRDFETVEQVQTAEPDDARWLCADEDDDWPLPQGAHVLAWRNYLLTQAGHARLPTMGMAFGQMPVAAARGIISVRGVRRDEGAAEAIPADAWADLEIVTWRSVRGFVAAPPRRLSPEAWWSRL